MPHLALLPLELIINLNVIVAHLVNFLVLALDLALELGDEAFLQLLHFGSMLLFQVFHRCLVLLFHLAANQIDTPISALFFVAIPLLQLLEQFFAQFLVFEVLGFERLLLSL